LVWIFEAADSLLSFLLKIFWNACKNSLVLNWGFDRLEFLFWIFLCSMEMISFGWDFLNSDPGLMKFYA
jgi:hypothetical protein